MPMSLVELVANAGSSTATFWFQMLTSRTAGQVVPPDAREARICHPRAQPDPGVSYVVVVVSASPLVAVRGERAELPSAVRPASTPRAGRRCDNLPGEGAPGRHYDQLPVRGADCEGTGVRLLKDAQNVGHRLAVTRCGPTPADHDPLADVGRCEPDLLPVAHSGTPLRPSLECVVIAIAL